MPLQHLLVLTLVLASATFVLWQSVRSLRGKKSKVGSCCARGCESQSSTAKPQRERVIFLPVEMLGRRK
jgi:hypothetical protein